MKDLKKGDEIKISTIHQVSELSEDQFEVFVKDLANWHSLVKGMDMARELCIAIGMPENCIQNDPSFIHWVYNDDGVANIGINFTDDKGATRVKTGIKVKRQKETHKAKES